MVCSTSGNFLWSPRFVKKILRFDKLWNNPPSSTSAADATTNRMTAVLVWKAPFNTMGSLSLGIDPIKNVCMYDFALPELKGRMCRNVCSLSYPTHETLPLPGCCSPDNPAIACTSLMSDQWLLFVPSRWSWGPWGLSCWRCGHNIIWFLQSFGLVLSPRNLILVYHWGEQRLSPQIAWVLVHMDSFGVDWWQRVHTPGVSFLYNHVDVLLAIIPPKSNPAVYIPCPIHGKCICGLQTCQKVFHIGFIDIFYVEIIDDGGKQDGARIVVPRSIWVFFVPERRQFLSESFIGKYSRLR